MIRLFLSDGDPAPLALLDVGDDDHSLLLDVLDGDASVERRADGGHTAWLVDEETVGFLAFNGASTGLTETLHRLLATREVVEVTWEEV